MSPPIDQGGERSATQRRAEKNLPAKLCRSTAALAVFLKRPQAEIKSARRYSTTPAITLVKIKEIAKFPCTVTWSVIAPRDELCDAARDA
jgi:hypothetical protein